MSKHHNNCFPFMTSDWFVFHIDECFSTGGSPETKDKIDLVSIGPTKICALGMAIREMRGRV